MKTPIVRQWLPRSDHLAVAHILGKEEFFEMGIDLQLSQLLVIKFEVFHKAVSFE